jgi:hypothetical protein
MKNTPNTTNMINLVDAAFMFQDCQSMTVAPNTTNMTNVENAVSMFEGCKKLSQTPNIANMTKLKKTECMFSDCFSLTQMPDLSNLTQLEDMRYMFALCQNLKGSITLSSNIAYFEYIDRDGNIQYVKDENGNIMTNCNGMFWMCYDGIEVSIDSSCSFSESYLAETFNPGGYTEINGVECEISAGTGITVKKN